MRGDGLQEVGVCYLLFVGSDVDIGCIGKHLHQLVEDMLQLLHPLVGLHGMAHVPLEGGTMARHVDLWDDGDTIVGRCADNVAALFLRVVFPGKACHRACCGELGITLHLEAPRLVLRQVEVERVHFEASHEAELPFQLTDADVAAPHIVHEAAQLEGRPVYNLAGLHLVFRRSFRQLG